jgi:hypothetical protein
MRGGKGVTDNTFGWALSMLKAGRRVRRRAWDRANEDGYVAYLPGYPEGIPINPNTATATGLPVGTTCRFRPYLMRRTAAGDFVPWSPTVTDVLAEDWLPDLERGYA